MGTICACAKARGFGARSMNNKSRQGSLFSYFKPVNKSSGAESSLQTHTPVQAKTNGAQTSVRRVSHLIMLALSACVCVCIQVTPSGRKRAAKKSPAEEKRAPKRQKQSSDESGISADLYVYM